ncbi:TetR/AcrR family transcriptional regulator [Nitrospira sp. Kam-Ns4a]
MAETLLSRVERRKEKTRKALMEVALALFYEKGIYWTKIEDITEEADIGKGTFYQYFETKEKLLRALLEEGLEASLARMHEAAVGAADGAALLCALIRAKLDFYLEHPEYLLFFHQVRGWLQLKTQSVTELREVYDRYLDRVGKLLRPAVPEGLDQEARARWLALTLSAFTSGLVTYALLFDGAGDVARRRDEIQAQLERGLLALL